MKLADCVELSLCPSGYEVFHLPIRGATRQNGARYGASSLVAEQHLAGALQVPFFSIAEQ